MMKDFEFVEILRCWVSRPKMYAYTKIDKTMEYKRCKDTKKCLFDESFNSDDYNTCIFDSETINKEQMVFNN